MTERGLSLEERFWRFIVKGENNSNCWRWIGSKQRGYGQINKKGKPVRAHRLSYEIHHGPINEKMFICHHCDNPECCNPSHLFQGTARDNNIDMKRKGRYAIQKGKKRNPESVLRGEKVYHSKLKEEQVRHIRRLKGLKSMKKIAEEFKVSENSIEAIIYRKSWKHLE